MSKYRDILKSGVILQGQMQPSQRVRSRYGSKGGVIWHSLLPNDCGGTIYGLMLAPKVLNHRYHARFLRYLMGRFNGLSGLMVHMYFALSSM